MLSTVSRLKYCFKILNENLSDGTAAFFVNQMLISIQNIVDELTPRTICITDRTDNYINHFLFASMRNSARYLLLYKVKFNFYGITFL